MGPGCLGMQQPCRLGGQKNLAEGQVGGMQCSQITAFLCRCWLLVLPHCPSRPPPHLEIWHMDYQVLKRARFGSIYQKKRKKERERARKKESPSPVAHPTMGEPPRPREGPALPPGRPSARRWQRQVLGQSDGLVTSHEAG